MQETRGNVKYRLEDSAVNKKSIKDFLSKFYSKKLKPFLKSEPLPEDNSGPVKTVVSKNFNEIVLDKTKVVLLPVWILFSRCCSTCSWSSMPPGAVCDAYACILALICHRTLQAAFPRVG
jgi:hypothetical protein